jgi:hypothetical protein
MSTNLDRFKKDLARLIALGGNLENAMQRSVMQTEFDKVLHSQFSKDEAAAFLKDLPDFHKVYDTWYSESLALLRQLLPDRVVNFVSFYEKPKGRKVTDYSNYVIQDFLQGLRVTFAGQTKVDASAAIPQFRQQLAIVEAAKRRFESSLFEIRQIVQADLFDSEIDAARELLKHKFLRAAGAVAGVVLEKHLRQVCDDHKIAVTKKNPTIGDLNELLKKGRVIDVPPWRHISLLGDLRNLCDHDKDREPTEQEVSDLVEGTAKVLKTIF